jgi:MYXO-CTERM domain-containing protein
MNGTQNSIWFAQTGDGGNAPASQDYHAYSSGGTSATLGYNAASGVFAAGTDTTAVDNANAYYKAIFPGATVPATQASLSGIANQTGTVPAGAPGFSWVQVTIDKEGNTVTESLNGTLIATINNVNTLTLSGNDIELVQSDVNGTASTSPSVEFGLIDDVKVTQTPEPTTMALGLAGVAGLALARRRRAK